MSQQRPRTLLMGLCATILVLGALHLARSVVEPAAFAIFIVALAWPLKQALQPRIGQFAAMGVTLLATVLVVALLGYVTIWGLSQIVHWLINNAARLQAFYGSATAWLADHGIYPTEMFAGSWSAGALIGTVQRLAGSLNSIIVFGVVTLVYVMLALLECDLVGRKLSSGGEAANRLLRAGSVTAEKLRTYMLLRTFMSVVTGLFVWGGTAALGFELALAFGIVAFTLNYIPFIGPTVATLLPTTFAFIQFTSWQMAAFIFLFMNVIQFVTGSYIEPRLAGRALAVSPFLVLLAVFFWSFMWGISGAFIGVPLLIAAMSLLEVNPSTRWFAELLSGAEPTTHKGTAESVRRSSV
jgi:AI-2 transport protein TqsA